MASKLFVDEIESSAASGISIVGEIKLNTGKAINNAAGTALLTEAGALGSSVTATVAEIGGVHTTGSVSASATALTVASGSGISDGDFVVGEGITPGTTVASGGGTVNIVLSANAIVALSTDSISFYSATKAVTPGVLGGRLCRAWVNFNGVGTVAIRGSFNVSTITDIGTGTYEVNFSTIMPNTNYAVAGLMQPTVSNAGSDSFENFSSRTTAKLRLTHFEANTARDSNCVSCLVFGA